MILLPDSILGSSIRHHKFRHLATILRTPLVNQTRNNRNFRVKKVSRASDRDTTCKIKQGAAEKMSFMLAIVGTKDNPLYSLEFGTSKSGGDGTAKFREDQRPMNQFILHSSLDVVEEVQWASGVMYMKSIDKFNNHVISTFLTAGNVKFMLLHDVRNDDGIKQFFGDVYDLYTKTLMSPFYDVDQPIRSAVFDGRVKALARKYL